MNKKYFINLVGVSILSLFVALSSCGQTKDSAILGTWIIDSAYVKAPTNLPAENFNTKSVIGQVYTFNADSTFLKDSLPGGKYAVTKEGNKMFLTFLMEHMGVNTKAEIMELTQKTFVYKMDYGNIIFTIHSIRKS